MGVIVNLCPFCRKESRVTFGDNDIPPSFCPHCGNRIPAVQSKEEQRKAVKDAAKKGFTSGDTGDYPKS